MTHDEIKAIVNEAISASALSSKEMLTIDEAARYMGTSKSHVYKLTMKRTIPFYRPSGKLCFIRRQELEQWLQTNRIATEDEINDRAQHYCMTQGAPAATRRAAR